jgi:hypothetical protein
MIGIEDVAVVKTKTHVRWRPLTVRDYDKDPKLQRAYTHIKNSFDATARLEDSLVRSINELPNWQKQLQDSAKFIHSRIKSHKEISAKNQQKIHVVFTGKSAFISETILKAAFDKYGSIGLEDGDCTTLDSDENILLYISPPTEIEKVRLMLQKHGLQPEDKIIVLDDHFGMGIKATSINNTLLRLGYHDVEQIYLTGYPGTNSAKFVPSNTVIASPSLPFTNFMRGINQLLDGSGLVRTPTEKDKNVLQNAFVMLSKLI